MIRNLILAGAALVIVFWIGLAYWVNKDARQRIRNWFPILLATALGLVPFVGPLVYLLLRPGETRAEIRTRNVEIAAFEAQIDRNRPACPECSAAVESDYLVCPVCTTRLHHPCVHCNAPLEPLWQTCPYCATPIEADVDLDMALTREARAVAASDRTAKRAKV